jgi:hypothetical protein
MPSKGFLLLAADQADELILPDRTAHRHGGLRFGRGWLGLLSTERRERAANRLDQVTEISDDERVSGDAGDDDLSCTFRDRRRPVFLSFFRRLRHRFCLRLIDPMMLTTR